MNEGICDLSLIRKDILDVIAKITRVSDSITKSYLAEHMPESIDFMDLARRVHVSNMEFLIERKEPTVSITPEELVFAAELERFTSDQLSDLVPDLRVAADVVIESTTYESIACEWQRTPNASKDAILMYLHGGGFYSGSPKSHRRLSSEIGRSADVTVVSVDYRLTPEYAYPAALEDAFNVYTSLLDEGYDPAKMFIGGDSAGGYLTLTTLLKIRDEGLQMPAGGVCISPITDLTMSFEPSFENAKTDIVVAPTGVYWIMKLFLRDADPSLDSVSPLFANLENLPPLLFQASEIELLYYDSERFVHKAREAGVSVTFQTWKDSVHVFHWLNLPEAKDAIEKIGVFIKEMIR